MPKYLNGHLTQLHTISECLAWGAQEHRRELWFSENDEWEADREALCFHDDTEHGPPLAWVLIWDFKYSNMYADVLPPSIQDWGYIFWDMQIWFLDEMKVLVELMKACGDHWEYMDPRQVYHRTRV